MSPGFCSSLKLSASGSHFVLRGIQGIYRQLPRVRGYISVMANLKFTYFLNLRNNIFLKLIVELLLIDDLFIA
jgi:hypothetical protein